MINKKIFFFLFFLFIFQLNALENNVKQKKEVILTYDLKNLYNNRKYTQKDLINDIKIQVSELNKKLLKTDNLPYLAKVQFANKALIYYFVIPKNFVKNKQKIIKTLQKKYKLSNKQAKGLFIKSIALYINNKKNKLFCNNLGFQELFKKGIKIRMSFFYNKINKNTKIIETEISKCF